MDIGNCLFTGISGNPFSAFIKNYEITPPVIGDDPIHRGLDEIVFELVALLQLFRGILDQLFQVLDISSEFFILPKLFS